MRSDSKSKAKEGFAPLKQDDSDSIFNDEPAGAVGGGNSAAKKKELTKKLKEKRRADPAWMANLQRQWVCAECDQRKLRAMDIETHT